MKSVKVGMIGLFDMLKFKNLGRDRENYIQKASASPLPEMSRINEMAKLYHPERQFLKIAEIIEENADTKSFVLVPDKERGTAQLAPFKAGSYLNISLRIGSSVASRAYSISSGPKDAFDGRYMITVKRKVGGFMSEYLLDSAKVGDRISAGEPFGRMTYNRNRDAFHVVAVAGGTGITPFRSYAEALADGSENFSMTLLYGVRKVEDILFKDTFDKVSHMMPDRFRVVYFLSDETRPGFEAGLIGSETIGRFAPSDGPYSIFAAGPSAMLSFLDKELPALGLARKYIRLERTGEEPENEGVRSVFRLTVHHRDETFSVDAMSDETVLTALERSGYAMKNMCRLGGCGFCRSRMIAGNYAATKYEKLRIADRSYHFFHPCCSYPLSDMEIEVPEENQV